MRKLLALVTVLVLIAACGGSSDVASPTASPTAEPFSATPTAVPTIAVPQADEISVPGGFSAYAVATGFYRPTSLAIGDDGSLFVSLRHGAVQRLTDSDSDGVLEQATEYFVASAESEVTGLLFSADGGLYVSVTGQTLLVADTNGDGAADEVTEIIGNLPHGRHQNNGLVLGPDGLLYLTNGSTCDDCSEDSPLSGTILRANPDGTGLRVYATGLRNPYDLAFDSEGNLWATDNGSDEPCGTVDELNLIVEGGDYGWPYAGDGCDPFADGTPPAAGLGLHTASTGIASYEHDEFPADFRGALFISLWGSFFADPELPPQILSVRPTLDGPNATVQTFAQGFQHPIDVAVDHDGSLLVLDYGEGGENDTSGTLYRIVYTGDRP